MVVMPRVWGLREGQTGTTVYRGRGSRGPEMMERRALKTDLTLCRWLAGCFLINSVEAGQRASAGALRTLPRRLGGLASASLSSVHTGPRLPAVAHYPCGQPTMGQCWAWSRQIYCLRQDRFQL